MVEDAVERTGGEGTLNIGHILSMKLAVVKFAGVEG
jgi:hypothetical protein